MRDKVLLGLSGGVDSAVAACLLKKDYDVTALYLDIADENERRDAETTAKLLDIPFMVRDVRAEREEQVCKPFLQAYLRGETPNPCIMCNPGVKFKALCDAADEMGAPYIATGHYARCENGALYKGRYENDQSYMLCSLRREQAKRLLLPLGRYEKAEVRRMAEEFGLSVAKKRDSMEICFIPDRDHIAWMRSRAELPGEGSIFFCGEEIGRHEGICCYTVGQRLPGLYHERKIYVGALDAKRNAVIAVLWEELFKKEVTAADMNWLIDAPAEGETIRAAVRVRHTKWENPDCEVTVRGSLVHIVCEEPVRAPAPGQAAALYQGDRLIGGGRIV